MHHITLEKVAKTDVVVYFLVVAFNLLALCFSKKKPLLAIGGIITIAGLVYLIVIRVLNKERRDERDEIIEGKAASLTLEAGTLAVVSFALVFSLYDLKFPIAMEGFQVVCLLDCIIFSLKVMKSVIFLVLEKKDRE